MNKTLKTVVAVALLSMPMTTYTMPAFSGTAPVATGNGGTDGRNAVIGLAILTLLAIIFGSDGGSIGMGNGSAGGGNGSAGSTAN